LEVVAEVEVRGESVAQILGGEVVQRCPGHGSCERCDVVSLIIDALQQLRQRRPVSLSEESLVELACQRRPPLVRPDRSRPGRPSLDLVDSLQGSLRGPPSIEVPLLHVDEQGPPHRRQAKVEAGGDSAAALVPVGRGAGGDDPRRLGLGLLGWQAGEPFLDKPLTERPRLVQDGSERLRAVGVQEIGRVSALREPRVSGVEAVGGEHPEVAFGGDPAGDVGVGGHDRVLADGGELAGLLSCEGRTEWCDTDVAAALAKVTAMASIGPSTITGTPPAAPSTSFAPKSWAPLWNRGVWSAVLRYQSATTPPRRHAHRAAARRW